MLFTRFSFATDTSASTYDCVTTSGGKYVGMALDENLERGQRRAEPYLCPGRNPIASGRMEWTGFHCGYLDCGYYRD
jgi:hypothetical protein